MGIKPEGVKKANIVQGSSGRLMVELHYYDGREVFYFFKGEPSELVGPLPNTAYLKWRPITREEFEAMGPTF